VKIQVQNLGVASLKNRWVRVSLEEDSLLEERFWNPQGSWKDFLEGKKLKVAISGEIHEHLS